MFSTSREVKQILAGLFIAVLLNVGVQAAAMWQSSAVFEYRLKVIEAELKEHNSLYGHTELRAQVIQNTNNTNHILEMMRTHMNVGHIIRED